MISEEVKASQRTSNFLKSISHHLSGREDCRGVEYTVDISYDERTGYDFITISPYITVFPDTYTRKESDRRSVAHHVITHHFEDIFRDATTSTVHVYHGALVPGKYVYRKFKLTPRRKWRRLPEIKSTGGLK